MNVETIIVLILLIMLFLTQIMSMKDGIDVIDFLIGVLKEHEVNLDGVLKKFETLSQGMDSRDNTVQERSLIEKLKIEVENTTFIGHKILIVDDDEFLAETGKAILGSSGYNVEIVTSGIEAIERTKEKKFDLIFMDIKLPDIDGGDVARILNDQSKNTKVVMITGYERLAGGVANDLDNVKEILMKPVSPGNLIAIADKILKKV